MTFCSDACVHEHKIRTQPVYAAEHVLKRDHGICCQCGLDTVALFDSLKMSLFESAVAVMRATHREHRCHHPGGWGTYDCGHDDCIRARVRDLMHDPPFPVAAYQHPDHVAACDAAGLPPNRRALRTRLWEMDHILPVVEGGGDCGLDNLRTLCWACHARETADLARRRAATRKQHDGN